MIVLMMGMGVVGGVVSHAMRRRLKLGCQRVARACLYDGSMRPYHRDQSRNEHARDFSSKAIAHYHPKPSHRTVYLRAYKL